MLCVAGCMWEWFWGVYLLPFTVHKTPKMVILGGNGLKQAKRLTVGKDSKHAGFGANRMKSKLGT